MSLSGSMLGSEVVPMSLWQYDLHNILVNHRKLSLTFRFETRISFNIVNLPQANGLAQQMTTRDEKSTLWVSSDSDAHVFFYTTIPSESAQKVRIFCHEISKNNALTLLDKSIRIESEGGNVHLHLTEGSDTYCMQMLTPPIERQLERLHHLLEKEKSENDTNVQNRRSMEVRLSAADATVQQLERLCQVQEREIQLLQRIVENNSIRRSETNEPYHYQDHDHSLCGSVCERDQKPSTNTAQVSENIDTSREESMENEVLFQQKEEQEEKSLKLDGEAEPSLQVEAQSSVSVITTEQEQSSNERAQAEKEAQTQKEQTQLLLGIAQHIMCTLCPENMQWPDIQHMEQHFISTHLDEDKKNCRACPSDRQTASLIQHIRQHANKIYACEFCGKRGQKHLLKAHIRTHTGEKPFSCDTCGRGFADGSTLRRHKMVHTGEKKHECPICGRTIARKDNVKVHIRSHGLGV